ncbi:MAG: V-type ATP synthase subunit K [Candidatus Natronoplasma sp.]
MKRKAKIRKKVLISLLAVILLSSLAFLGTALQPVEGQNEEETMILVDGEDPDEEKTLSLEPDKAIRAVFSVDLSQVEGVENITWNFEDGEETISKETLVTKEGVGDYRVEVTYRDFGEYDVELKVETEEQEFTDSVTIVVEEDKRGMFLATIGAGLAVGIAGMGAGIGVGIAGAAGAGTIAEKPDKFGLSLVFQALPQTQAIYGLLVAILLFLFTGVIGEPGFVSIPVGIIAVGIGLSVGLAGLSAIGQGIASASGIAAVSEDSDMFGKGMVFSVLPETQAIYGLLLSILLMIFSGLLGEAVAITPSVGFVGVGAGLAVGIAGLSGIGQGIAAASGIATVAEDEGMFGRAMVFSVLPETQAIYGLLIGILLIVFSGMMGGEATLSMGMGIAAVGAGLAIGIAGISGIGQGITSGSAIAAVSNREETFGKGMIFSVMSETFAIFGLLVAILIIVSLGFMG